MYTRRNGNRAICRVHASSIEEFYATLNDSITIDGTARSFVPIPRVKAPRMASVAIKMDENVTQGIRLRGEDRGLRLKISIDWKN